jgi:hypothetical protein
MPQREPLPHSVEPIFKGEALIPSLFDESTHRIIGVGIPWFEPFGVM